MTRSGNANSILRTNATTSAASLFVAIFALIGVAGCTPPPQEDITSKNIFDEILLEAQEGGAGELQVEILKRAADANALGIDDARQAARETVACLTSAGVQASYVETATYSGVTVPGYQAVGEDTASWDSCETQHSLWVNKLYQLQPSSVEANSVYADSQEPVLRECLESSGVATDPEATGSELATTAATKMPSCLMQSGIDSW